MGFKPTLGVLSLEGVFPLSATLDHAGLFTRTMPDMIAAFRLMTGRQVGRSAKKETGKLRLGVPSKHFLDETEERVAKNFWGALDRMKASGDFTLTEVETDPSYERFTTARACDPAQGGRWFYEELAESKSVASKMNPDVLTLLKRGLGVGQIRYLSANLVRLESIRVIQSLAKGARRLGDAYDEDDGAQACTRWSGKRQAGSGGCYSRTRRSSTCPGSQRSASRPIPDPPSCPRRSSSRAGWARTSSCSEQASWRCGR